MKSVILLIAAAMVVGCASAPSAQQPAAAAGCPIHSVLATKRSARPLVGTWQTENHKFSRTRVIGAELIIPVAVGMSREYVEHAARCEVGRTDVRVRVLSAGDAYAVQITSDNPAVANEIVARFGG